MTCVRWKDDAIGCEAEERRREGEPTVSQATRVNGEDSNIPKRLNAGGEFAAEVRFCDWRLRGFERKRMCEVCGGDVKCVAGNCARLYRCTWSGMGCGGRLRFGMRGQ